MTSLFRTQPIETLLPLIFGPEPKGPPPSRALAKLKNVFMAMYFGFDHVVWFGQIGVYKDKERLEQAQKLSFWGWLLGSACASVIEVAEIGKALTLKDSTPEEKVNYFLFYFTRKRRIYILNIASHIDRRSRTRR